MSEVQNKKENKVARAMGSIFAYTVMLCASALVVALTIKLIMWIL